MTSAGFRGVFHLHVALGPVATYPHTTHIMSRMSIVCQCVSVTCLSHVCCLSMCLSRACLSPMSVTCLLHVCCLSMCLCRTSVAHVCRISVACLSRMSDAHVCRMSVFMSVTCLSHVCCLSMCLCPACLLSVDVSLSHVCLHICHMSVTYVERARLSDVYLLLH